MSYYDANESLWTLIHLTVAKILSAKKTCQIVQITLNGTICNAHFDNYRLFIFETKKFEHTKI